MPAQYMLIRITPSGEEKHQGPVSTKRTAATLAAYVLHDNAGTSKRYAQRFAARLHDAPLDTTVHDEPTGYKFCIMSDKEL